MSHGGDYRLYELTQFVDGVPCNVPYKNDRLYKALLAGIDEQHMPYNLPDLAEIMDTNANFYTLTTNEIWYYWGEWMEDALQTLKENSHGNTVWNTTTEHTARLNISKQHQNGLLYHTSEPLIQGILNVLHLLLRYAITELVSLSMMIWCLWDWSLPELLNVLSYFSMYSFL